MSIVWLADDLVLGRQVAVKKLSLPAAQRDAVATGRMSREARAAARLNHPHAVSVYDLVEHDGEPFLIMEYVDGESLAERIRRLGHLSVDEVARIGVEIATALAAAHRLGIVHRDIKPANIMVDASGRAKLADFGIARSAGDAQLTGTGELIGTIEFMAPESARVGMSGEAADVYSLAATLYAALEGQAPHHDETGERSFVNLIWRLINEPVCTPEHGGFLAPVLMAMLAAEPGDRPTAAEVVTMIEAARTAADGVTTRGKAFDLPFPSTFTAHHESTTDAPRTGGASSERPVETPSKPAQKRPVETPI